MQEKIEVLELPVASTTIEEITVSIVRGTATLQFNFTELGYAKSFDISFIGVRAYRKLAESLCTKFHVEGAYDKVAEIRNSEWVSELKNDGNQRWRDHFPMRHFIIYVDSFGSFEAIAAECATSPIT
jgi:hypothetical protein